MTLSLLRKTSSVEQILFSNSGGYGWKRLVMCFTNYFSFLKLIPFFFSQNLNHRLIRTCQAGFTSSSFAPTERCCWTRAAITSSNYCVTGLCSQTFPCWETLWRVWRDTWKRLLSSIAVSFPVSRSVCWHMLSSNEMSANILTLI